MRLGTAHIIQGNALALPLPDASVDLICTSPPYFGLRSYQDSCQACGGTDPSGPKMSGPSANSTLTGSKANRSGTDRDHQQPDPDCTDCGGSGKGHYAGQIGSEATPQEFLDALIAATREMVRVLKPSGSIFVNLGDKYSSTSSTSNWHTAPLDHDPKKQQLAKLHVSQSANPKIAPGVPTKSLIGIPWRYAIRCIDELGLILRAEIIWSKPNGLPESVTDRVRRSHEQWFHFTVQPRYFSAVDEIREPHTGPGVEHFGRIKTDKWADDPTGMARPAGLVKAGSVREYNPLGKLPGSVWTIPTQPLTVPPELGVDHFAAYPMEWPRRIIQGWTPRGICVECGFLLGSSYDYGMLGVRRPNNRRSYQDRTRPEASTEDEQVLFEKMLKPSHSPEQGLDQISQADNTWLRGGVSAGSSDGTEEWLPNGASPDHGEPSRALAGAIRGGAPQERNQNGQPDREPGTTGQDRARQATEAAAQTVRMSSLRRHAPDLRNSQPCPHCGGTSFRPSVILDNFGGTGTTALVAKALGRIGISVDLSHDYCRLAEWRCNDPRELAAALQVEKPEPIPDGQLSLFGDVS